MKGEGQALAETLGGGEWQLRTIEARQAFPLASPRPSSPRAMWCGSPESAPPFEPLTVTIEDAGGNPLAPVQVLRPTTVCAPYGLNNATEPPTTMDSRTVCYDLADLALNPPVIAHAQTALGTHTLEVGAVHSVCIPARLAN